MRFLMVPAPGKNGGVPPSTEPFETVFTAHMKYNEEMYQAGVLLASEGLNGNARAAHVIRDGDKRAVVDGPFTETKELVGGFYLIEVKTMDEAIAWALKYPGGMGNDDVLEIRPLTGAADIPQQFIDLALKAAPSWSATFLRGK